MTRALRPVAVTVLIIPATAGWLRRIGRVPICQCGWAKLWHGDTM